MSDSAKFTITDGIGSWLQLDSIGMLFPGTVPIYFGYQFFVPAASETIWDVTAHRRSPIIAVLADGPDPNTYHVFDQTWLNDEDLTGYDYYWDDQWGDINGSPLSITGSWHQIEVYCEITNPGPYHVRLDGTELVNTPYGPFNAVDSAFFGAMQQTLSAPTGGDLYIARMRIGTTDGGVDILDWDGSIATDFSAFTTVVGTVVLDTAPVAPPAWISGGGGPPPDTTPPILVDVVTAGADITLDYNETLITNSPTASQFTVKNQHGATIGVSSVAASGTTVVITCARTLIPDDFPLQIDYTPV